MTIIEAITEIKNGNTVGVSCDGGQTGVFLYPGDTWDNITHCHVTVNIKSLLSCDWDIVENCRVAK